MTTEATPETKTPREVLADTLSALLSARKEIELAKAALSLAQLTEEKILAEAQKAIDELAVANPTMPEEFAVMVWVYAEGDAMVHVKLDDTDSKHTIISVPMLRNV